LEQQQWFLRFSNLLDTGRIGRLLIAYTSFCGREADAAWHQYIVRVQLGGGRCGTTTLEMHQWMRGRLTRHQVKAFEDVPFTLQHNVSPEKSVWDNMIPSRAIIYLNGFVQIRESEQYSLDMLKSMTRSVRMSKLNQSHAREHMMRDERDAFGQSPFDRTKQRAAKSRI
jgi:hypothetical protein